MPMILKGSINPKAKRIIHSMHITFDESAMFNILQDLFDSPTLHGKKPKKIEIVFSFILKVELLQLMIRRMQLIRHHMIFDLALLVESDVYDAIKDFVQGGADGDLGNIGTNQVSRHIRKASDGYESDIMQTLALTIS